MTCGRCHTDLTDKDVFPVRELPPDAMPRAANDIIYVDDFGLPIPRWKIKTVCKECLIEITE